MPVDISIKQVPDDVADKLRQRARQNHRSLQGELRVILDQAVGASREALTVRELYERATARGRVDTGETLVQTIRTMRDERISQMTGSISRRRKPRPRS